MPFNRFTEKQKKFIKDIIKSNTKRINILEGSVRSGKTYVSLIAWMMLVSQYDQNGNFLMVGKTLTSLKRNCLSILEDICPQHSFNYSIPKKEAKLFNRRIFLEGVNDSRAEHKIRGMTLQAAYCDEITLFSEDFFAMLLSRLSMPNAKLLGTTNPDSPTHWLMKKYLVRKDELNMKVWKFLLDDNETIDKETREDMKKEYTGVFYDRFILGNWVQAEGLVYSEFANETERYVININDLKINEIDVIYIGIDYGASKSKTAFVAVGFMHEFDKLVVLDEAVYEGVMKPDYLYVLAEQFYRGVEKKFGWICCCFADWGGLGQIITLGLKTYMSIHCNHAVVKDCSKQRIIERIQILNRMIGANRFCVLDSCKNTIEALSTAIWDPKKEDTRLDDGTTNIDIVDALEYAFSHKIQFLKLKLDKISKHKRGIDIV